MNLNITLIAQMITFGLFVWFTKKLIWPHILGAMQERSDKIADGLAAAERGQNELRLAQDKAAEQLRKAKQKAAEIVDAANNRASKIVEQAKEEGILAGERLLNVAKAEIEQERVAAKESLHKEIVGLSMAAAEKILGHSIDKSANNGMIERLIDGVASGE